MRKRYEAIVARRQQLRSSGRHMAPALSLDSADYVIDDDSNGDDATRRRCNPFQRMIQLFCGNSRGARATTINVTDSAQCAPMTGQSSSGDCESSYSCSDLNLPPPMTTTPVTPGVPDVSTCCDGASDSVASAPTRHFARSSIASGVASACRRVTSARTATANIRRLKSEDAVKSPGKSVGLDSAPPAAKKFVATGTVQNVATEAPAVCGDDDDVGVSGSSAWSVMVDNGG